MFDVTASNFNTISLQCVGPQWWFKRRTLFCICKADQRCHMVRRPKLVSWCRLLAANNSSSLLPRLKFDDDRVTPATLKEVLEENYGGEPQGAQALNTRPNLRTMKRFTNAYMLVYMRECMMDEILNDVTTTDIPPHLSKLCIVC